MAIKVEQNIYLPETCFASTIYEQRFMVWAAKEGFYHYNHIQEKTSGGAQAHIDALKSSRRFQPLRLFLTSKLREGSLPVETQKKLIGSLMQLDTEGDPAWECVQTKYRLTFELMETCKNKHANLDATSALRPGNVVTSANSSPAGKIRSMFTPPDDPDSIPHNILFVEDLTERVSAEFPELWKLGQAYFKGELHVEPDTGKQGWIYFIFVIKLAYFHYFSPILVFSIYKMILIN